MDNTYDDISKIYDEYLETNKQADIIFVKNIVDIILKNAKLNSLVTNIVFDNFNNFFASYNYFTKTLNFDTSILNINNLDISKMSLAANNATILQYIMHECTHVNQFNKVLNCDESIENKILKYTIVGCEILREKLKSLIQNGININMLYMQGITLEGINNLNIMDRIVLSKKGYILSPAERMAQYKSILIMQSIINNSKYANEIEASTNISNLEEKIKLKGYYKRNGIIYSPIERYFEFLVKSKIKDVNKIANEVLNENISLEDRLYYGLPITSEEYTKVKTLIR